MRAYFVTGTDTGVGKTTVSVALLAAAGRRRLRTGCMKPAESGCSLSSNGQLQPSDAIALGAAANMGQDLGSICPFRFEPAVAPGVAAEQAGQAIDFERIHGLYQALVAQAPDFVLIEGAGGLLVPMGEGKVIADLAKHLGLPLLVVARPGLGTINHTLLTIEVAQDRGLDVAGVIFSSASGTTNPLTASNAAEIERASAVRYLGCLPRVDGAPSRASAEAAEGALDCDWLMRCST